VNPAPGELHVMSMNGVNIMTTQNLLSTALKAAEPILQEYVRQLKAEITKLNKQIANLEIEKNKFKE
jgi:predicted  nucleic acid-binding Zn-ribbon protein